MEEVNSSPYFKSCFIGIIFIIHSKKTKHRTSDTMTAPLSLLSSPLPRR